MFGLHLESKWFRYTLDMCPLRLFSYISPIGDLKVDSHNIQMMWSLECIKVPKKLNCLLFLSGLEVRKMSELMQQILAV